MSTERLSGVERPITEAGQDRLARSTFVANLTNALISPTTRRSAGVVMGITGPWGSGKSSILNLVNADILKRYPDAVIVRFDPWLVSGRDDLISIFLRELTAAMGTSKRAENLRKAIEALDGYATQVAPLIDLLIPNAGKGLKAVLGGANRLAKKGGSITATRATVLSALAKVDTPIVVLIDELDRVEDAEIRTMAQLIRAVADFPGLSYLLAYDDVRVAEALGQVAGDPDGRGRAYLEKIVQMPIPLPVLVPQELMQLCTAEVRQVDDDLGVSPPVDHFRILDAIVPGLVATPRDIKRLVGAYRVLCGMLSNEVSPTDILGYAALTVKAPKSLNVIRADPEQVVVDPVSFAETMRRVEPSRLEFLSLPHPDEAKSHTLLVRLFPPLAGEASPDDLASDALGHRRNLLVALRLGILPPVIEEGELEALLRAPRRVVADALETRLQQDTIGSLLDQLAAVYPAHSGGNDVGFWLGFVDFLNGDNDPELLLGVKRQIALALTDILLGVVQNRVDLRPKTSQIAHLISGTGDLVLTPVCLARHLKAVIEPGPGPRRGAKWFLSTEEANRLAQAFGQRVSTGSVKIEMLNLEGVRIALRFGDWSDFEQSSFRQDKARDLDRLALALFGFGASADRALVDQLCGWNWLHAWAIARKAEQPRSAALDQALDRLIHLEPDKSVG
ncbi:MAG: KAP family NTPase [Caulobacteraceae bacterium]|nr:KAP family NTPase [Caulobacteraceae bacterium]